MEKCGLMVKCLNFAEGKRCKDGFAVNGVKCPDFPSNLIIPTEIQEQIFLLEQNGLSTREIALKLGLKSNSSVIEKKKAFKTRQDFYIEWMEFWNTITDIRELDVGVVFGDFLGDDEILHYRLMDINTVGDYLKMSVSMSVREMQIALKETTREKTKRTECFNAIRRMLNIV